MVETAHETWTVGDLVAGRVPTDLVLSDDGSPRDVLRFVDVGTPCDPLLVRAAAATVDATRSGVFVGIAAQGVAAGLGPLVTALDCTLTPRAGDRREAAVDVAGAREAIASVVTHAPRAAAALRRLLLMTEQLDVAAGLAAESSTYSMLLAGPEFRRWRADRPVKPIEPATEPAVVVDRQGNRLLVELNRPHRHNAYDRTLRDGLIDAFDLALGDPSIRRVEVRGRGPSFCSGGDLDEFGQTTDVAAAHLIRLDRGVGARIHACRDRVDCYVHGACIGAGVELPAFAGRVVARPDTRFELPELRMGLVPGAGGTVSMTKRIGRWRTAYLALSGALIDAATALEWGLVDELAG